MTEITPNLNVELITIIVEDGKAETILKYARSHGVKGGTITLGRGTVRNAILEFIGLGEARREILYLLAEQPLARTVLEAISRRFEFDKRHHGIAFTTPVCAVTGSKQIVCQIQEEPQMDQTSYHVINVIVDKGRAEDVVAAADAVGSRGGTILNARGAGVHETARVFSMDIEPEKEIVLIVAEVGQTESIIEAISQAIHIDEPGNGVIYVQNALQTRGLFR